MKRLKMLMLAVVTAWAPAAFAQGQGYGIGGSGSFNGSRTSAIGVVRGTVLNVDWARGLVTVSSGGGRITLRAVPTALQAIYPGNLVSFQYMNFAGQRWISPQGGMGVGGSGMNALAGSEFAQMGNITGYVAGVNKASGIINVRGVTFHAHPLSIQNVIPGQFVTLDYAQIQNVPWVTNLAPVAAGAGMGGQFGGGQSFGGGQQAPQGNLPQQPQGNLQQQPQGNLQGGTVQPQQAPAGSTAPAENPNP